MQKFVQEHDGWFAILGNRNPSRIEIAKVPWYERHGGDASASFGLAEVMNCLLPWFIDLYNDAVRHHNSNTSCHCRNNPRWELFYASRRTDEDKKNAESALKSMQDIIRGIEDGTLVVPDQSMK